jgi:type IV secretion system protein VirD4
MHLETQDLLQGERPLWTYLPLPLAIATATLLLPIVFTQSIAHQLSFHSALGTPWLGPYPHNVAWGVIGILGCLGCVLYILYRNLALSLTVIPAATVILYLKDAALYPPLAGGRWYLDLIQSLDGWGVILRAASYSLVTAGCVVGAGIVSNNLLRRRHHPSRIAHGSARYARLADLKRSKLVGLGGVFLGVFARGNRVHYLSDSSQHHTLFVMPPGAGKSAGHIVPSLLTQENSAFVLDPKGELYDATAGWREAQGHRCIRLAPLEDPATTDCWNPLLGIDRGGDAVGHLALLADALISETAQEDSHWNESARTLFRCLALHTVYAHDYPTMHEVRALAHHSQGLPAVLQGILGTDHDRGMGFGWRDRQNRRLTRTHPEAALLARGFLKTPEKELGSIASTLRRGLALWGDDRIMASTSHHDFDLDIFNGEEPVTLYCVVPYSDLHQLAPWVRMLLASLVRQVTTHRNAESASPLDLYLDEFASLGQVKIIHQILSFLRGYGVRAHIVVQAYEDLKRLYGLNENISNCQIHVTAATLSRSSRQFISDLGGDATVQWERRSNSGAPIQPMPVRQNRTPTETRRPLITPGEVATLSDDDVLIAKAGVPMIRAKKCFYFHDRVLYPRSQYPAPERRIRQRAEVEQDDFFADDTVLDGDRVQEAGSDEGDGKGGRERPLSGGKRKWDRDEEREE